MTAQSIRFDEAGATFEIHGAEGEPWWMEIVGADGVAENDSHADFDSVCRAVDEWLERNAGGDDSHFTGFEIVLLDHELRFERTARHPTRGALLAWFDDGDMPTMDELVELAEISADRVLVVRDCGGNVLLDRREAVEAALVRDQLMELRYDPLPGP